MVFWRNHADILFDLRRNLMLTAASLKNLLSDSLLDVLQQLLVHFVQLSYGARQLST